MTPCTSAAPFSAWHRVNGQRVVEYGWPQYVPWWVAVEYEWQEWTWKSPVVRKQEWTVLKAVLSSLDDDLLDMTDEEVKSELADARVDLAESERRWLKLERDALARLRGEKL